LQLVYWFNRLVCKHKEMVIFKKRKFVFE